MAKNTVKKEEAPTIKRAELFGIRQGLMLLSGVKGVYLGRCRAKLSREIEQEIQDMEAFKQTPEWKRIDKMLTDINLKHCEKDGNGNPKLDKGMFRFNVAGNIDREKDVQQLKDKEKAAFTERARLLEEYSKMLEEDMTTERFTHINLSYFPEDIDTDITNLLWPVITDDLK